jgi:eukaryotic-like serine/threonine-protein kinase
MAPELFSPARSVHVPPRVSHYDIVRMLGRGGMGEVYLARDLDLDRLVALKFLHADIVQSAEKLARFHTEARAISALNHPYIATIFAIEETGGLRFLVLEYLPGGSLRDRLDARRAAGETLPAHEAAAWGLQIAEGLAHAHRHEIVHRDIKASNILFTDEERIKITDFGLAKILAVGATESNTASGCLMGTPVYMAPEQARGLPADKRSDVFSLGVLLFEMYSGKTPFQAPDMPSLLHQIVFAPAPPLRGLRPEVDDRVAAVVERALAKSPDDRYQDAGELARDLRQALGLSGPEFISNPETVTLWPAPRRVRRKPAILVAAVLAAAMALGGVAYEVHRRTAAATRLHALPDQKRIAVLPFTNVGGDPANLPLADGLMEFVSNSLTRLEQFHGTLLVTPASDVRREGVLSAGDAGRKLGVNLAITGSVERIGPADVQVFINLVDTATVTQLRSESIRAKLADLLPLQEGVVGKIARMLELAFQPQRSQQLSYGNTAVPAAYPHYVEGLGYLRRYDRPQNIDNAIASFRRALTLDPTYVLAYAGAAQAYWRKYDLAKDEESIEEALRHASQALALNDQIASVHVTMGMIRNGKGQHEMAEKEFRAALSLDPLNADAYRELANAYEAMGRSPDAEATYLKAIELRKDDWWSVKELGVFYYRHGRYPEAESRMLEVTRLTHDSAKAYSNLGGVYLAMGKTAEAETQFKRSVAIEPNANAYSNLGTAYFYARRYPEAVEAFEKATQLNQTDSRFWMNLADAYRWTPALSAKAAPTYRRAIGLIEKEIAVNPRDAGPWSRVAMAHASLGEHKQAIAEIEKALELAPGDGFVHFRAALVYEQAYQRERALREAETALKANRLHELMNAPPLEELRKDPRFRALVERRAQAGKERGK